MDSELEKEIAWLKRELDLVPVSRRRMMGRTVLASYERDLYKSICERSLPGVVSDVDAAVRWFAQRRGLEYALEKTVNYERGTDDSRG